MLTLFSFLMVVIIVSIDVSSAAYNRGNSSLSFYISHTSLGIIYNHKVRRGRSCKSGFYYKFNGPI